MSNVIKTLQIVTLKHLLLHELIHKEITGNNNGAEFEVYIQDNINHISPITVIEFVSKLRPNYSEL